MYWRVNTPLFGLKNILLVWGVSTAFIVRRSLISGEKIRDKRKSGLADREGSRGGTLGTAD